MRTPITTRLAAIALLVLPLIIDRIEAERGARKDRRDDELVNLYECDPPSKCTADFDGDGTQAKIEVQKLNSPTQHEYVILVTEREKEILRLPYDHTDGTMRTHTAVNVESGTHRLVVYDKASRQKTVGVFGWDGRKMTEVAPSPIEKEILAAMAAHDDTGGWNERALGRPALRAIRLIICYLILVPILAITFYQIRRASSRKGLKNRHVLPPSSATIPPDKHQ